MTLPILLCVHSSQLGVELVSLSAQLFLFLLLFLLFTTVPSPPKGPSNRDTHGECAAYNVGELLKFIVLWSE